MLFFVFLLELILGNSFQAFWNFQEANDDRISRRSQPAAGDNFLGNGQKRANLDRNGS